MGVRGIGFGVIMTNGTHPISQNNILNEQEIAHAWGQLYFSYITKLIQIKSFRFYDKIIKFCPGHTFTPII